MLKPKKKPKKSKEISRLKEWPKPSEEQREFQEEISAVENLALDWKSKLDSNIKTLLLKKALGGRISNRELEATNLENMKLAKKIDYNKAKKIIIELNNELLENPPTSKAEYTRNLLTAFKTFNYLRQGLTRKEMHDLIEKWGGTPTKMSWKAIIANGKEVSKEHLSDEHVNAQLEKFFKSIKESIEKNRSKSPEEAIADISADFISLSIEHNVLFPEILDYFSNHPEYIQSLDKEMKDVVKKAIERHRKDLDYIQ